MNVYDRAAQILKGHHTKGAPRRRNSDGTDDYCLVGAITHAATDLNVVSFDPFRSLDGLALEQYPDRVRLDNRPPQTRGLVPAAAFNDHPDTTEDEVIALLEKASIQHEERAGL